MRLTRDDLFARWDIPECWLAGLLWADGCMREGKDGYQKVVLSLTDLDAVEQAAAITGCCVHSYAQKPPRKALHTISFSAVPVMDRLAAIGFKEPKLSSRPWPALPFPAAFLRGVFDGDGSVSWHRQGGRKKTATAPLRLIGHLSGSAPVLEGAQDLLARHGITPKRLFMNGKIHRVGWNHADCQRLAEVLYADSGPRLGRKRAIFFRDTRDNSLNPRTAVS